MFKKERTTKRRMSQTKPKDDGQSNQKDIAEEPEKSLQNHEIGKLFVGGLSWKTSDKTFRSYFEGYGELSDCVIMMNKHTRKPRGFGFVLFKDPEHAVKVLHERAHIIDEKKVEIKPCSPKSVNSAVRAHHENKNRRRVFVGGLSLATTDRTLFELFENNFGPVDEAVVMRKPGGTAGLGSERSRGFGFVTFISEISVIKACQRHYVVIEGKMAEIKKAELRNFSSSVLTTPPKGGDSVPAQVLYGVPPQWLPPNYIQYNYSNPPYITQYVYPPPSHHIIVQPYPGQQPPQPAPIPQTTENPTQPAQQIEGAEPHLLPFYQ